MNEILTPQNITFGLGIIGIMFTVYHYFKNPQIKSEKTDALFEQRITCEKEASNDKFNALTKAMDNSLNLAQNHIHSVDVKIDKLTNMVNAMNVQFTSSIKELSTIINERMPRK